MTAQTIIQWLWQWTWQGSIVIGLVLLVRGTVFRRSLVPWRSTLWLIVLARLLLPLHPASGVSLFNLPQWIGSLRWPHSTAIFTPITEPKGAAHTNQRITIGYGPAPRMSQMPEHAALPPHVELHGVAIALMSIWVLGVIAMLTRTAYSQIRFSNRLRCVRATDNPILLTALQDAARWMHIANPPPLLVTDLADSPAISGLLRPRLLLSPSSAESLTPGQLRNIFLHELAHLKRSDLWVDLLCTIVLAAQWFNPLAWLAFAIYRSDREIARDAMALNAAPNGLAENYGGTIVTLLERLSGYPSLPAGTLGILEQGRGLRQRMVAITEHQPGVSAWRSRLFVVAIMAIGGIACLTSCKQSNEQKPATTNTAPNTSKKGALETRTYDITDLLVDIPDFNNAPALSGISPATTKPSQPPRQSMTRDEKIRAIIKMLHDIVDPDSWKQYANVRENSQHLIVYQSHENQEVIAHLLQQLREGHGIEITVEARFITLDLDKLKNRPDLRWIESAIDDPGRYLDEKQSAQLLKADVAPVLSTPRITLFNGQRAYVLFGEQLPYVSHFKKVSQSSGKDKYEPVLTTLQTGVLLDCQATVSSDRHYVTLTLRPQISKLQAMSCEPWKESPAGRDDLIVQIPQLSSASLQTTVSVPNQGTLVLALSPVSSLQGIQSPVITPSNHPDGVLSDVRPANSPTSATVTSQPATRPADSHTRLVILVRPSIIINREAIPKKN